MNNQAMRVVRIEADSLSDIFAVVVQNEHELGMPEGFANWNGNKWSWIDKRTSWTLALNRLEDKWITVDFSGQIVEYSSGTSSTKASGTSGVNDCCVIDSNLYTVGLKGGISRYDGHSWNTISNEDHNALYSIDKAGQAAYACGSNGIVLKVNNDSSEKIPIDFDGDLNTICCCADGQVFAAGGRQNDGVIVDILSNHSFGLSTRPGFIRAMNGTDVWIVDWQGSVWRWDGATAKSFQLPNEMSAFCLGRRKQLVFGGLDSIAIYDERSVDYIPLDLDSSFLYDE